MESTWIQILQQLVTTLAGAVFVGLSALAGFYVKRLTDKVQRKSLSEEITRYVKWAEQSPSFKEYTGEERYEAVAKKAMKWSSENGISLTDDELMIYIESSVKDMKLQEGLTFIKPKDEEEEKLEVKDSTPIPLGKTIEEAKG